MNIKFKSIKLGHFIFFAILSVFIGAFILVCLILFLQKIPNDLGIYFYRIFHPKILSQQYFQNSFIAFLGIITGIPIFMIFTLSLGILKHEYIMELNHNSMEIKSRKYTIKLLYEEIKNIIIWNNTDYAKIIVETNSNNYKYYIGLANLNFLNFFEIFSKKNQFVIFESFIDVDRILKNNYSKVIKENKGKSIVEYRKK